MSCRTSAAIGHEVPNSSRNLAIFSHDSSQSTLARLNSPFLSGSDRARHENAIEFPQKS